MKAGSLLGDSLLRAGQIQSDNRDPAGLQAGGGCPGHGGHGGHGWDPAPRSAGWLRPAVVGSVLAVALGEGSPCSALQQLSLGQRRFCPRQSCGLSPGPPCFSASLQQLEEVGQPR